MWKYDKEFRTAHPETIGETDKQFDLDNYKDWLEQQVEKLFAIPVVNNSSFKLTIDDGFCKWRYELKPTDIGCATIDNVHTKICEALRAKKTKGKLV